jgi:hypothetical protein
LATLGAFCSAKIVNSTRRPGLRRTPLAHANLARHGMSPAGAIRQVFVDASLCERGFFINPRFFYAERMDHQSTGLKRGTSMLPENSPPVLTPLRTAAPWHGPAVEALQAGSIKAFTQPPFNFSSRPLRFSSGSFRRCRPLIHTGKGPSL